MMLENFKLEKAPPSIYYIPDFITKAEEESLLKHVNEAPKPRWKQLTNRRLQNWGGLPHPKGMVAEDLPKWLQVCAENIAQLGVFEDKVPNHVLVNEYLPGQGIMPHVDGPLYYPTVSTISLGSHTLLDFYSPLAHDAQEGTHTDTSGTSATSFEERYLCSFLLEPRSLVLVRDSMYTTNLHGIKECTQDILSDSVANLDRCVGVKSGDALTRTTRVSLTIRYVPLTIKAKLLFGKRR